MGGGGGGVVWGVESLKPSIKPSIKQSLKQLNAQVAIKQTDLDLVLSFWSRAWPRYRKAAWQGGGLGEEASKQLHAMKQGPTEASAL